MKIKRLVCFLFVTVLLVGMVSIPASAYDASELPPTEVFLIPEQIDEDTYYYRDETGDVVVIWENVSDTDSVIPRAGNGEQIYWKILSEGYKHGDYYFATGDGTTVGVEIDFSPDFESYLGYYTGKYNRYSWLSTPSKTGFHTKLTVMGSASLTLAIKNMGPKLCVYEGYYYATPMN